MATYVIPKKDHDRLYIFEGTLLNYTIKNNELCIIVNCVEYPDLPEGISEPEYLDWVKIKFKQFSYLKFEYGYSSRESDISIYNLLELGELPTDKELLDYGGVLEILGSYDIPTSFTIEIVCQEIELEFLPKEFYLRTH